MTPGPVIIYSADLDVTDWERRHTRGSVPDRWPYGLDHITGAIAAPGRIEEKWRLHERVLRRVDSRFDWRVRAPRDAPVVCWDERVGVPVAATRGRRAHDAPIASGVIWLTDADRGHLTDRLVAAMLQRCDALWVFSLAQVEELHRRWKVPTERIHYFPLGVDEAFWTPATDSGGDGGDGDGSDGSGTVLVVGNDRDRDHAGAVRAVELARRTRPQLRLSLVSRQPVTVAPDLGERLSDVAHDELARRYRAASVVALAMHHNLHCSGATALLEAMACARPVVASATPGMSDYIDDGVTGRLVPPGDDRAMAAAIAELDADPVAAAGLGRAARAAVEQRFTSRELAARIAGLVGA